MVDHDFFFHDFPSVFFILFCATVLMSKREGYGMADWFVRREVRNSCLRVVSHFVSLFNTVVIVFQGLPFHLTLDLV